MRRLIPLFVLATAACTPMQWVRQDTTPEQFSQDLAYCHQEAWREAQLSLLHSKDFSNPYFWAAFTITGQWK